MTKRTTQSEPVPATSPEWRDRSRFDRVDVTERSISIVSPFSLYR